MVLEVFQKVFAGFPGIARFARRGVVLLMILAFGFALASIGEDLSVGWTGATLISRYSVVYRTITSAISLFLIFVVASLAWMPVPLPRNTSRHSVIVFSYFLTITAIHYVINTSANRVQYIDVANLLITLVTISALASWYFLLTPEGEAIPVRSSSPRASARELLARMEELNQDLSRSRE